MTIALCRLCALPDFACPDNGEAYVWTDVLPWGVSVRAAIDIIDGAVTDDVETDWSTVDLSSASVARRGLTHVAALYPALVLAIDVSTLAIEDDNACVLGQLHGRFSDSWEAQKLSWAWLVAHGFICPASWRINGRDGLAGLEAAWVDALVEYRAGVR